MPTCYLLLHLFTVTMNLVAVDVDHRGGSVMATATGAIMARRRVRTAAMGAAVRRIREEFGWTQEDLAAKTGIPVSGVGKRENGETIIRAPEQASIAKAFGMTAEEFDKAWRAGGAALPPKPGGYGSGMQFQPTAARTAGGWVLNVDDFIIEVRRIGA